MQGSISQPQRSQTRRRKYLWKQPDYSLIRLIIQWNCRGLKINLIEITVVLKKNVLQEAQQWLNEIMFYIDVFI
jgi:hypothetical protein